MRHLILGAGPAGVIAAETLAQGSRRTTASSIIGDEPEPPYSRMAIPYLLAGRCRRIAARICGTVPTTSAISASRCERGRAVAVDAKATAQ